MPPMTQTPLEIYKKRIDERVLLPDSAQFSAVKALDLLFHQLAEANAKPTQSFFQKLKSLGHGEVTLWPKGLYIYGGVGRGKSMLMDLFFGCLPENITKRRVHFHAFMVEVHDYIHSRRSDDMINGAVDQALPMLGEMISRRSRVLCFDEFHVTDITDAMILGRLFRVLFERDVVVVTTSNWPPDKLYEGGLQRERFLPFIDLLKEKMDVLCLESQQDYRALTLQAEGTYFCPLGLGTSKKMQDIFLKLTDWEAPHQEILRVKGRNIPVQAAKGFARFTFSELCEKPLGAEDYLHIAKTYHTVFLENIPRLGYDRRNEVKRLMNLIDALYEAKVRVVISAAERPEKLYQGSDHSFEFERTISRLLEMQGADYPS